MRERLQGRPGEGQGRRQPPEWPPPAVRSTKAGSVRNMKGLQRPILTRKRCTIPLPVSHLTLTQHRPPGGRQGELRQPPASSGYHRGPPWQQPSGSVPHEIKACFILRKGPLQVTCQHRCICLHGLSSHRAGRPQLPPRSSAPGAHQSRVGRPALHLPPTGDKLPRQDSFHPQRPKSTASVCGLSLLGRHQGQEETSPALRKGDQTIAWGTGAASPDRGARPGAWRSPAPGAQGIPQPGPAGVGSPRQARHAAGCRAVPGTVGVRE